VAEQAVDIRALKAGAGKKVVSPQVRLWKDAGCPHLENAARFLLSPTLDDCGKQPRSAMLENPNLEKVSLSVD
jgi:hypothetical protein